jgi:hypothetical protein
MMHRLRSEKAWVMMENRVFKSLIIFYFVCFFTKWPKNQILQFFQKFPSLLIFIQITLYGLFYARNHCANSRTLKKLFPNLIQGRSICVYWSENRLIQGQESVFKGRQCVQSISRIEKHQQDWFGENLKTWNFLKKSCFFGHSVNSDIKLLTTSVNVIIHSVAKICQHPDF